MATGEDPGPAIESGVGSSVLSMNKVARELQVSLHAKSAALRTAQEELETCKVSATCSRSILFY